MSHEYLAVAYVHSLRARRAAAIGKGSGSDDPSEGDDPTSELRVRLGALLIRMGARLLGAHIPFSDVATPLRQGQQRQRQTGSIKEPIDAGRTVGTRHPASIDPPPLRQD